MFLHGIFIQDENRRDSFELRCEIIKLHLSTNKTQQSLSKSHKFIMEHADYVVQSSPKLAGRQKSAPRVIVVQDDYYQPLYADPYEPTEVVVMDGGGRNYFEERRRWNRIMMWVCCGCVIFFIIIFLMAMFLAPVKTEDRPAGHIHHRPCCYRRYCRWWRCYTERYCPCPI